MDNLNNCIYFVLFVTMYMFSYFRDQNHKKDVKKIKSEKKTPHSISNRALNNVVSSLNKPVEMNTDSQEENEDHIDDAERWVVSC